MSTQAADHETPTSTIPAARAWLLSTLQQVCDQIEIPEVANGRGVSVVDGYPVEDTGGNDTITIGPIRRTRQPLTLQGFIGPGSTLEKVTIELTIEAFDYGSEGYADVAERAYLLLGIVEHVVDMDPFLGTGGDSIIRAACEESDMTPAQGASTLNVHITYEAQI